MQCRARWTESPKICSAERGGQCLPKYAVYSAVDSVSQNMQCTARRTESPSKIQCTARRCESPSNIQCTARRYESLSNIPYSERRAQSPSNIPRCLSSRNGHKYHSETLSGDHVICGCRRQKRFWTNPSVYSERGDLNLGCWGSVAILHF